MSNVLVTSAGHKYDLNTEILKSSFFNGSRITSSIIFQVYFMTKQTMYLSKYGREIQLCECCSGV